MFYGYRIELLRLQQDVSLCYGMLHGQHVCPTKSCNVHVQLCAPVSRYLVLGVQV